MHQQINWGRAGVCAGKLDSYSKMQAFEVVGHICFLVRSLLSGFSRLAQVIQTLDKNVAFQLL